MARDRIADYRKGKQGRKERREEYARLEMQCRNERAEAAEKDLGGGSYTVLRGGKIIARGSSKPALE